MWRSASSESSQVRSDAQPSTVYRVLLLYSVKPCLWKTFRPSLRPAPAKYCVCVCARLLVCTRSMALPCMCSFSFSLLLVCAGEEHLEQNMLRLSNFLNREHPPRRHAPPNSILCSDPIVGFTFCGPSSSHMHYINETLERDATQEVETMERCRQRRRRRYCYRVIRHQAQHTQTHTYNNLHFSYDVMTGVRLPRFHLLQFLRFEELFVTLCAA